MRLKRLSTPPATVLSRCPLGASMDASRKSLHGSHAFVRSSLVEKKDREAARTEEAVTFEPTPGASDDGAADEPELAEDIFTVVMADVLVCAQGLVAAPMYLFFVNARLRRVMM